MKSERVVVKDSVGQEANVVLESGPRTLRPASKAVLELVSVVPFHECISAHDTCRHSSSTSGSLK